LKKKICFFYRKSLRTYSIERAFQVLQKEVRKQFKISNYINKYESKDIFKRVYDIICASFHQADINHLTGDVHYINYLFSKKKTILTIHDIGSYYRLKGLKKLIFWLLWIWLPIKKSSIVTTVSQRIKHEILQVVNINPKKIRVLPVPISKIFKPSKKVFNKNKIKILHIGGTENKNLGNHIKALKNRNISFELVVICSNPKDVRKMLKNVDFKFTIISNLSLKKIYQQYISSDILLFASLYEGFGLPIIEAQAVGRPVITSHRSPMKETANGSACLVNPNNPSSIYAGLEKVIKSKKYRKSLVAAGFQNAKKFNAQTVARNYIDLYKKF